MKQVLQSIRSGEVEVKDVPPPGPAPGRILVRIAASLVSPGTERMMMEFSSKSLLRKAQARPDLVRQVMGKVRKEGLLSTVDAVRNRLEQPMPLGYSCAGTVIHAGEGVDGFQPGDPVACAGAGYAVHAEYVSVPKNLAAKVPPGVDLESAAFATLGAIAMHGLRLAQPQLGETVAVIGLGLLGQITLQLLKAAGCRCVGTDLRQDRVDLALKLGAEGATTDPEGFADQVMQITSGAGADAVLITADSRSDQPVELAARAARDRAVVVAVGAVGTKLPRKPFFEKELEFRISRSYGPGRYDPGYEEQGQDYPIGYVRWTENRNMQSFLDLAASAQLDLQSLVTHRFEVENAGQAYELIGGEEPFLGVLIVYRDVDAPPQGTIELQARPAPGSAAKAEEGLRIGLIGAGTFATGFLLPAISKLPSTELLGVCSGRGASARTAAERFGFGYCSSDPERILQDAQINAVVIATRHDLHCDLVVRALSLGKHVFCEKPLCLDERELERILRAYGQAGDPAPLLAVGFNRRFSPWALRLKSFLEKAGEPLLIQYRVNAGYIPPEHWVHDPREGGGRIIGEVCHFVDFLLFLTGQLPTKVSAHAMPDGGRYRSDNLSATLTFADGSQGVITYSANGDTALAKERVEAFGGGRSASLDNFRSLELYQDGRRRASRSLIRQDKGYRGEWERFRQAACGESPAPFRLGELAAVSLATFRMLDSIRRGGAFVDIDADGFLKGVQPEHPSGPQSR